MSELKKRENASISVDVCISVVCFSVNILAADVVCMHPPLKKYLQQAAVRYKGRAVVMLGRCMKAFESPTAPQPHRHHSKVLQSGRSPYLVSWAEYKTSLRQHEE